MELVIVARIGRLSPVGWGRNGNASPQTVHITGPAMELEFSPRTTIGYDLGPRSPVEIHLKLFNYPPGRKHSSDDP